MSGVGWHRRGTLAAMSTADIVEAPAKLTLSLRITGVRADGYHLIDAEMIALDLHDTLTITLNTPGAPDAPGMPHTTGLSADGPFAAGVPLDGSNLVAKALVLANRTAAVHLHKQIPHGGGLGGGSADAAAVLRWAGDAARLPVDAAGQVRAASALNGLVAVQHVNNETGVIQPLDEIAAVIHASGGLLLADCAQSAGKQALPSADLVAVSAHKFGGPIGIGALLVRDWALLRPTGGQERGYRGGTENLPGAMAMAAALEAGNDWLEQAAPLRQRLDEGILAAGGEVVAADAPRLATISGYRMPGRSANAQLIRFDGLGMAVSAGSACSSGSLKASPVLTAMGYPHAGEVIRVSIGRETTQAEIDAFLAAWRAIRG